MDKKWLGIAGTVLAVALIIWLIGGPSISCRQGLFDKDKQIIEIKH